jgi:hypothetical protein
MKIDYVVISSDDNPMYKDFYPIVSKIWNSFGLKTYFINITNENSITENEYGFVHKIKSIDNIPSSYQSQIVRLFSPNLIDGNILMSDIDMIPLNYDYFKNNSEYLLDDNIVVYTTNPYTDRPFHAMCYLLGNSKTFKKILGTENMTYEEFVKTLESVYGHSWFADENFFYDKSIGNENKMVFLKRDIKNTRIDRSKWVYDVNKLHKGTYIDSHLLRPYSQYLNEINELIKNII